MRGESKTGWGSDSETDPNKTLCREGLDDKTRCLIKGGMSNFFFFFKAMSGFWMFSLSLSPPLCLLVFTP